MYSWQQIKRGLTRHYKAPQRTIFRQFRNGGVYFSVGLIIIYLAHQTVPPSPKQEFLVLSGLVIGGSGFIIAMLAYMRLVISRFIRFYESD